MTVEAAVVHSTEAVKVATERSAGDAMRPIFYANGGVLVARFHRHARRRRDRLPLGQWKITDRSSTEAVEVRDSCSGVTPEHDIGIFQRVDGSAARVLAALDGAATLASWICRASLAT